MSKFRQYQVFAAAVEQGSLSGAAKVLDLSVAAVSKQIRALETATKTQLLDRTATGVRQTELGRQFYLQCRDILATVDKAESDLQSAQTSMNGRISVTLSRALAVQPVFAMLAAFSALHPGIRFDLIFDETLQNLRQADIDFALRIGRVDDLADLVSIPLIRVRPVLCATPEYLEKLRSDYHDETKLIASGNTILTTPVRLTEPVRDRLRKWGIDLSKVNAHTATDLDGVQAAIRAGLCMGILLDLAIERDLSNGTLLAVRQGDQLPSKRLYLLFSRERLMLQRHLVFKNFVRDYLKDSI